RRRPCATGSIGGLVGTATVPPMLGGSPPDDACSLLRLRRAAPTVDGLAQPLVPATRSISSSITAYGARSTSAICESCDTGCVSSCCNLGRDRRVQPRGDVRA